MAKHGRIDAIINDTAIQEDAGTTTADYVQALAAETVGIKCMHIATVTKTSDLEFERFFDAKNYECSFEGRCVSNGKTRQAGKFRVIGTKT